jgi:hypothetical protein
MIVQVFKRRFIALIQTLDEFRLFYRFGSGYAIGITGAKVSKKYS